MVTKKRLDQGSTVDRSDLTDRTDLTDLTDAADPANPTRPANAPAHTPACKIAISAAAAMITAAAVNAAVRLCRAVSAISFPRSSVNCAKPVLRSAEYATPLGAALELENGAYSTITVSPSFGQIVFGKITLAAASAAACFAAGQWTSASRFTAASTATRAASGAPL